MSEQVLDVKEAVSVLRRFWRTVAVFMLVGVLAATAYEFGRPVEFHATALVLLPDSGGAGAQAVTQQNSVTTDAGIATSAAVLVPAGRQAAPSLSPTALARSVTATVDTGGVLAITARGPNARRAESLANAVAQRLVTFVTTGGLAASSHVTAGLQGESNQLNRQLAEVKTELAAAQRRLATEPVTSPSANQDAALVTSLTSEQATIGLELNSVKSQIAQAELSQLAVNQGTEVIQRATTASGLSAASAALVLVLGAVAGLLVGAVFVLARHRRDPRLSTRDAMAQAVGAPVLLALDVSPRRSGREWATLFEKARPGASECWHVQRALHELDLEAHGARRVVLVAFHDDAAGVAQALEVVVAAACSGLDTVVSLVAEAGHADALQATCTRIEALDAPVRPHLRVRAFAPAAPGEPVAGLTAAVFVVDRRQPKLATIDRRESVTVLSVSSGFATADELARLAIVAADSGEPVQALFLANPAPDDRTTGRLPDTAWPALALRRRTREAVSANAPEGGGEGLAASSRRSAPPRNGAVPRGAQRKRGERDG